MKDFSFFYLKDALSLCILVAKKRLSERVQVFI